VAVVIRQTSRSNGERVHVTEEIAVKELNAPFCSDLAQIPIWLKTGKIATALRVMCNGETG
jgi:hypothetical protein